VLSNRFMLAILAIASQLWIYDSEAPGFDSRLLALDSRLWSILLKPMPIVFQRGDDAVVPLVPTGELLLHDFLAFPDGL